MNIIGRTKEINKLLELYKSKKSEFIAIYGRRRIGKTFLINHVFEGKFAFKHAGLSRIEEDDLNEKSLLNDQLKHFYKSLLLYGYKGKKEPKDWFDAFFMLEKLLIEKDDGSKQVVFIDELPWLDTKRSKFITAFEGFYNTFGSERDNLLLIVCGSANSWILDNLINNHGGLYGRLTYEMKLSPFSLLETEQFLNDKNIKYSRYDITELYMIFGGIPFYLNYIESSMSLAQNIDNLFYKKDAILRREFERMFSSIFYNPEKMISIIVALSENNLGLTREEISNKTNIPLGGYLSKLLNSLIHSDFIIEYIPFGFSKRDVHYKLIDLFSMFYIKFVKNEFSLNKDIFLSNLDNEKIVSWKGFSFENVCFNHLKEIKTSLGISGVKTNASSYRKNDGDKVQIDLIIDRNDNIVDLCEMKFYSDIFTQNLNDHLSLTRKEIAIRELISRKKSVQRVLITTFGIKMNEYYSDYNNLIILDDLFK